MGPEQEPLGAVLRLEDKISEWMDEQRRATGELHQLFAQVATRQAVADERIARTQSDVDRADSKATAAHHRIDTLVEAQAQEVGQRTGAERARTHFYRTLTGTVGIVGLIVALGQFGLAVIGG